MDSNGLEQYRISARLMEAEQAALLRAQNPDRAAKVELVRSNWFDKVVALVVLAMLATPVVFIALRSI